MNGDKATGEVGSDLIPHERREEFVQCLEAVRSRLLRFTVSLVGSPQDAEDIVQRASITMWRRFSNFEQGSDFLAWAFAYASFEAKNFSRRSNRSIVKFDDTLLDTLSADRAADLQHHDARLEALEECMRKLDPESRALLEAVYTRGEEIKDLASREGRATQTFYNRLNFIRRTLTDCMRGKVSQTPQ